MNISKNAAPTTKPSARRGRTGLWRVGAGVLAGAALLAAGTSDGAPAARAGFTAADKIAGNECRLQAAFVDARLSPIGGFALHGTLTLAVSVEGNVDGKLIVDERTSFAVGGWGGRIGDRAVSLNVDLEKGGLLSAQAALDKERSVCDGAKGAFAGPGPSTRGVWSAEPLPTLFNGTAPAEVHVASDGGQQTDTR
jgi:hypothetical protein